MSLSQAFERFLPTIEADLKAALAPNAGAPPLFYRMLHYHMGWVEPDGSLTQGEGGKRIRPVLTLLTCEAAGGDWNAARPAAAAVELIHNFSLLHDDVEDKSPTRRGRPAVWTLWGAEQAINAGDAQFALAHLAIPRLSPPDADPVLGYNTLRLLDQTCLDLTRGQHLDMSFEQRDDVTVDEYLDMIGGKTAALLGACAQLGALSAGADEITQEHYHAFGHNLGMAFQALDDVLDIWGEPELIGKQAAIDIHQRKKSLPVLYALAHSEELRVLYADPAPFSNESVTHVITLLETVEARRYAETLAQNYSEQAEMHLEAAQPRADSAQTLRELVEKLLHRQR